MNVLLDTATFLWLALDDDALSDAFRREFRDPHVQVYLSAVSAWEIAVKHGLGKLPLPDAPERFVLAMREAHRIAPLPLVEEAALVVTRLPPLHRDPFDRMLIAQAIHRGLVLATPEPAIRAYPVRTLW